MLKKLSLIVVEYPDGRVAVQPCIDGKDLFENCQKCSSDALQSRMTHIELNYDEENKISVNANAKILNKAFK